MIGSRNWVGQAVFNFILKESFSYIHILNMRAFLFLFFICAFESSFCCDCRPNDNVKEQVKKYSLIVKGDVIKAEFNKTLKQDKSYLESINKKKKTTFFGPSHVNEYLVVVKYSYKGSKMNDTIIVRSQHGGAACGLGLQKGEQIILYADKVSNGDQFFDGENKVYRSSLCSRTKAYSEEENLAILKAIKRK